MSLDLREAVAWRVKDFADGWILFHSKAEAEREAEGSGNLIEPLFSLPQLSDLTVRIGELEGERDDAKAALKVCQQSLIEQAAARLDPEMPLLTTEVLESLRGDAEAAWACADTKDERVAAHGLSLLCDWQDRARQALAAKAGGDMASRELSTTTNAAPSASGLADQEAFKISGSHW